MIILSRPSFLLQAVWLIFRIVTLKDLAVPNVCQSAALVYVGPKTEGGNKRGSVTDFGTVSTVHTSRGASLSEI